MVDEDHDFQEDHYDEDWLNEENWFITDKDGVKKELSSPPFMKMEQSIGDGDKLLCGPFYKGRFIKFQTF